MFIKRIDCRTHLDEVNVASRLGSSESRKDERNHCVPILEVFSDDRDPWYQYIVMPVLRPFNEPNFTSFGEVVDFVHQTLEVSCPTLPHELVLIIMFRVLCICTSNTWHIGGYTSHFGHGFNLDVRSDCAAENILMDAPNLYDNGWHPMNTWLARNGIDDLCPSRKRSEAEIKYYFIDFGLSTQFASEERERLVSGELGRIQAPEQISGLSYDPFKLDIYYLGHVYQANIVDVCFLSLSSFFSALSSSTGVQKRRSFERPSSLNDETKSKGPSERSGSTKDLEQFAIASLDTTSLDEASTRAGRRIYRTNHEQRAGRGWYVPGIHGTVEGRILFGASETKPNATNDMTI